jgi:predicted nucleotidyltransferase
MVHQRNEAERAERQGRVHEAAQSPRLLTERFLLPESEFLRARFFGFVQAAADIVNSGEFPGLVALQFSGSFLKGYATEDSDIDFVVLYDSSQGFRQNDGDLKQRLYELSGVPQKLFHFSYQDIAPDVVERQVGLTATGGGTGNIGAGLLSNLFLFSSNSTSLLKIREAVISTFEPKETTGETGAEKWDNVMHALWDWEGGILPKDVQEVRKALYPKLSDARRVFLAPVSDIEALKSSYVP